ncbi:MAG: YdiU family protein [Cyanobacteria bacterium]|nr:YdiU family protein [Cyanobacteriota bacterium]MDA0866601.1 YdiU family protein [Cyanobacteriota bacterium]
MSELKTVSDNPLLSLEYEPVLAGIGDDFYDVVTAADFPEHLLRFRNDQILVKMGLDPTAVSDQAIVQAWGQFQGREPLLALRYHGYQFGEYNPFLGDGRGFLYGQIWGIDGQLYDLGTKGSGTTPYSRGGDGRLTLKGGVREVLATEALHHLGVHTSRTLSLVETGESLWRGDEPSPTRSSVMVRFSRSHIRFGTFERLDYLDRSDLIQTLLDHVIEVYYPAARLWVDPAERYRYFYDELVDRVARLAAQWMSVGFCHGVLNTDNMSITGESFDYGPYAFMDRYDPNFTAAYFDYGRLYCYKNQPSICGWNLKRLQKPLQRVIPQAALEASLEGYSDRYSQYYRQRMLAKLGFDALPEDLAEALIAETLTLLGEVNWGYHDFFLDLTTQFSTQWHHQSDLIMAERLQGTAQGNAWQQLYYQALQTLSAAELAQVAQRLRTTNPQTILLRPAIEAIWEPITTENNWQPFEALLEKLQSPFPSVPEPNLG